MRMVVTQRAPKKAVNLTINDELLTRAKHHQINLSAVLESALSEELRQRERANWIAENRAGFDAYNAWVDEHGIFSDSVRTF